MYGASGIIGLQLTDRPPPINPKSVFAPESLQDPKRYSIRTGWLYQRQQMESQACGIAGAWTTTAGVALAAAPPPYPTAGAPGVWALVSEPGKIGFGV